MQPSDSFSQLSQEAKKYYDSLEPVSCPALKADVVFNSDGYHHLRYSSRTRSSRTKAEKRNKLAYLPKAVETLKCSHTIQESRTFMEPVGTADKNGLRSVVPVTYYGFWAILDNEGGGKVRVKAIVRQVSNSPQYSFWSVMPYWVEKIVNGKSTRYFASRAISDD
jgi:hypothetical protein